MTTMMVFVSSFPLLSLILSASVFVMMIISVSTASFSSSSDVAAFSFYRKVGVSDYQKRSKDNPTIINWGSIRGDFSAITLRESKEDLIEMSQKLNPVIGYWDPLGLADSCFLGSNEATIGWLRHSEIKHGRIAMFAFIGYMTQFEIRFPWSITLDGTPFPILDLTPLEQWDILPLAGKIQILLFIGFLEFYSELSLGPGTTSGQIHYTKPGGQPGRYPPFRDLPHPVPWNLYDPLKIYTLVPKSKKEYGLLVEINNGRLAMIGIMSFMCEHKIPGSVPLLTSLGTIKPYDGQIMAPFEYNWIIDYGSILSAWGVHI